MIKAWLDMWKNMFNFNGRTACKEYWLALIANVLAMYILIIPFALIARNFSIAPGILVPAYLIAMHLPVLAIYVRRANDAQWKKSTTIYLAIVTPMISGLLVGFFQPTAAATRSQRIVGKIFALSFGIFFYGGVLGVVLYDDPTSISILPTAGILLGSLTLLAYMIANWKQVLAVMLGLNKD